MIKIKSICAFNMHTKKHERTKKIKFHKILSLKIAEKYI